MSTLFGKITVNYFNRIKPRDEIAQRVYITNFSRSSRIIELVAFFVARSLFYTASQKVFSRWLLLQWRGREGIQLLADDPTRQCGYSWGRYRGDSRMQIERKSTARRNDAQLFLSSDNERAAGWDSREARRGSSSRKEARTTRLKLFRVV